MANSSWPDRFEGEGLHPWQTKMKFVLMKRGIWSVTNGKDKKPSTRDGEVSWIAKDEKALAIIALGLSNHHIDGCETGNDAWEHLETVFWAPQRRITIIGRQLE